ncbi:MAG: ABC transporter permease subunit, partial [Chloroflexi bacterium]
AGLITGSIIIEGIFSVPGMGREFLRSILGRDYPLIMGVFLLYAFLISIANLSVDLVYGLLDPRIKVSK